jgi:hypothetical protein
MRSDAAQLVHCPRRLGGDVDLSRPHAASDSALLTAPLRCRTCATRFYKRVGLTQLPTRTALGRSHSYRIETRLGWVGLPKAACARRRG